LLGRFYAHAQCSVRKTAAILAWVMHMPSPAQRNQRITHSLLYSGKGGNVPIEQHGPVWVWPASHREWGGGNTSPAAAIPTQHSFEAIMNMI